MSKRRKSDSSEPAPIVEVGAEGELSLNEQPITFPLPLARLRELLGERVRVDLPGAAPAAKGGSLDFIAQMAERIRGGIYTWDSLGIVALSSREEPEQVVEIRLSLRPEADSDDSDPKQAFSGTVRWHGRPPATEASGYRPLYDEACEYLDRPKTSFIMFELPSLSVFAELDHAGKRVTTLGLSAGSSKKKKRPKQKANEPPAPTRAYDLVFDPAGKDGWAFGTPPGITGEQWPSRAGVALTHLFTVRIPEPYRCKGPEVVAMSVFQELDDTARRAKGKGSERPHSPHPRAVPLLDGIRVGWCLLYLTDEELRAPPAEDRAAKRPHAKKPFRLVERSDDPNVGRHYEEFPDWLGGLKQRELEQPSNVKIKGYVPMFSDLGKALNLVRFFDPSHFGGTLHPSQGGPRGLSLFFLEFDEALGGANLGGDGVAQIDLLTNKLNWDCG